MRNLMSGNQTGIGFASAFLCANIHSDNKIQIMPYLTIQFFFSANYNVNKIQENLYDNEKDDKGKENRCSTDILIIKRESM